MNKLAEEASLFDVVEVLKEVEAQPRRWKPYPSYAAHDSTAHQGLDELPRHWQVERLRFLARINPVKSEVARLAPDTEVSFVPMEAVAEYGGLSLEKNRYLEDVQQGYTYFRDGDVVIAKITPCFENGKGSIALGLTNGIGFGTTELHVLRVRPRLDRDFLFYLSISRPFRALGEAEMYGAGGQKRIPESFLANFQTPLPPLPEQRAIAAFLRRETARNDTLVEKKRRLIDLLKEKCTALISHAVTKGLNPTAQMKPSGVAWLNEVPKHWDIKRLKQIVRLGSSISYGIVQPGDRLNAGVPFVQTTDMTSGVLDRDRLQCTTEEIAANYPRSRLVGGEVLLGIRASVGAALIAPIELRGCNLSRGVARIDLADLDARFFTFFLASNSVADYWLLHQQGSTFNEVSILTVRELPVVVPPPDEQALIVQYLRNRLGQLDALIERVETVIAQLVEYRSALISAAVTGKIDVRDEVAA